MGRHMSAYLIKTLPELQPGADYSAHDLAATANAYSRAKIWDERLFRRGPKPRRGLAQPGCG